MNLRASLGRNEGVTVTRPDDLDIDTYISELQEIFCARSNAVKSHDGFYASSTCQI